MAEVVFNLAVFGANPGSNVCIVLMQSCGRMKAVVSEADARTAPQAELDGFRKALEALTMPCNVTLRTHSQCLLSRVEKMDVRPHRVTGVYIPKERRNG